MTARTGAFIDEYASGGGLDQTHFLEFIPGHQVTVVAAPVLDLDSDDSSTSTGADFNTSFTEDGGGGIDCRRRCHAERCR